MANSIKKKHKKIFPLLKGFKSTSIFRAFILNSLAIAIIAVFTIEIKDTLDKNETNLNKNLRIFITFLSSLAIGLTCYGMMWLIFGFGGGMLINNA